MYTGRGGGVGVGWVLEQGDGQGVVSFAHDGEGTFLEAVALDPDFP